MKENNFKEMLKGLDKFQGRKVELTIQTDVFTTINTFDEFDYDVMFNDEKEKDCLVFTNIDESQDLSIEIESIQDVIITGQNNIFYTVCDLKLKLEMQISLCLAEDEIRCCKCGKVINEKKYATEWELKAKSINYGSKFDGLGVQKFDFCDKCAWEISGMSVLYGKNNEKRL